MPIKINIIINHYDAICYTMMLKLAIDMVMYPFESMYNNLLDPFAKLRVQLNISTRTMHWNGEYLTEKSSDCLPNGLLNATTFKQFHLFYLFCSKQLHALRLSLRLISWEYIAIPTSCVHTYDAQKR